jgi:hypothetical protein
MSCTIADYLQGEIELNTFMDDEGNRHIISLH